MNLPRCAVGTGAARRRPLHTVRGGVCARSGPSSRGQKVDKKTEKAQAFDIQSVVSRDRCCDGRPARDRHHDDLPQRRPEGAGRQDLRPVHDHLRSGSGASRAKTGDHVHARGQQGHAAAAPPADAKEGQGRQVQAPPRVRLPGCFLHHAHGRRRRRPSPTGSAGRSRCRPASTTLYIALKERLPVDAKDREKTPTKGGVLKQTSRCPTSGPRSCRRAASSWPTGGAADRSAHARLQSRSSSPTRSGRARIFPSLTNTFSKKSEISIVFLIYNPSSLDNKPDVAVDYSFYRRSPRRATGEKFLQQDQPPGYSAPRRCPQFDAGGGRGTSLVAGQSLPLGSFPEGEWRLEIKVTTKLSGQVRFTQSVKFVVTA